MFPTEKKRAKRVGDSLTRNKSASFLIKEQRITNPKPAGGRAGGRAGAKQKEKPITGGNDISAADRLDNGTNTLLAAMERGYIQHGTEKKHSGSKQ